MNRLLFVHVPKTAGTSFRKAAESYYGSKVAFDYGENEPETDSLVNEHVYRKDDKWAFYRALSDQQIAFLGGHFHLRKYVAGFGLKNSIMFLRDPAQRLYSEFQHFVRHNGYSKDFASFYRTSDRIDTQARSLSRIPMEAVGFLGITEKYDSALDLINHNYDIDLKRKTRNKGRWTIGKDYDLDAEEVKEIQQLHRLDFELYRHACRLFEQRERLFSQEMTYVHGVISGINKGRVVGWAWWAGDRDDPVDVLIRVNGEVVGRAAAKSFRASLCQFLPPRGGHVGFEWPLEVRSGDRLDCQVRETGQVFPLDPYVVK